MLERAAGDDIASVHSGSRAEIDDVVGVPHCVFVMLDNDQGVASLSESLERAKELLVVSGVQPDGRLVQNVEHAAEVGSELGREANALRLAARERGDAAAHLHVAETDFAEKLQAGRDLGRDVAGDLGFAAGELEPLKNPAGLLDGCLRKRVDCRRALGELRLEALDLQPYGPGDGIEARAEAIRALFALSILPAEPGFLDGVGPGSTFDLGKVKRLAEAAAGRAPSP